LEITDFFRYLKEKQKMQSAFLNQIGLGSFDLGYLVIGVGILAILVLILLILLIIQIGKANKLKKRMDKFLLGKDGESLEQDITELFEKNKLLSDTADQNKKAIQIIYNRMETVYQKMGLVKYDAFSQMGGQLSFCLALLDEKNNGFLINSVHGTEGCYIYTKEIKNGECSLSLGTEESEALTMAIRG